MEERRVKMNQTAQEVLEDLEKTYGCLDESDMEILCQIAIAEEEGWIE
jgi:hypothetical protein